MLNSSETATSVRSPDGQQVDALRPLAARRGVDLDLALERVVLDRRAAGRTRRRRTASGRRSGSCPRTAVNVSRNMRLRGAVDLPDGLLQRLARRHEVVALGGEELEALALLGVLLDGQRVHRRRSPSSAATIRADSASSVSRSRSRKGAPSKSWSIGLLPLGLDALDDAPALRARLGELELQAVVLLGGALEPLPVVVRRRAPPCRAPRSRPRAPPPRPPRPPRAPAGRRGAPRALPATSTCSVSSAAASPSSWASSPRQGWRRSPPPPARSARRARAARRRRSRRASTWASCTCQWTRASRAVSCSVSSSASCWRPTPSASSSRTLPSSPSVSAVSTSRSAALGRRAGARAPARPVRRTRCSSRAAGGHRSRSASSRARAAEPLRLPGALGRLGGRGERGLERRPAAPPWRRPRPRPAASVRPALGCTSPVSASSSARRRSGPRRRARRRTGAPRRCCGAARGRTASSTSEPPSSARTHAPRPGSSDPERVLERMRCRPSAGRSPLGGEQHDGARLSASACHCLDGAHGRRQSRTSTACTHSPRSRSARSASLARRCARKSLSGPRTPPPNRSRAASSAAAPGARPTRSRSSSSSACAPRGELGQRLLGRGAGRRGRAPRARASRPAGAAPARRRRPPRRWASSSRAASAAERVAALRPSASSSCAQAVAQGRGLHRPLAQRGQVGLEGRALALERRAGSAPGAAASSSSLPHLRRAARRAGVRTASSTLGATLQFALDAVVARPAPRPALLQRRRPARAAPAARAAPSARAPRAARTRRCPAFASRSAARSRSPSRRPSVDADLAEAPRDVGARGLGGRRGAAPPPRARPRGPPAPSGAPAARSPARRTAPPCSRTSALRRSSSRCARVSWTANFSSISLTWRSARPLLPRQAPQLRLHLGDQVLDALQVRARLLEAALRAVLAVAVEADAGRLLEERAPLVGAVGEEQVDHLRFDDHAGVAAEAGAAQQVLDVAQPDRRAVEQVLAVARAGEPAGDLRLPGRRSAGRRRCCRGRARPR